MQESAYSKERRTFTRFTINIPVSYVDPSLNKTVNTYTHDISVEGLSLSVETKITCGTILEICLCMTDNGQKIMTRSKVVWLKSTDHKYRMGIKFDGPRLEPISLVLRTIQSQINADSSLRKPFLP